MNTIVSAQEVGSRCITSKKRGCRPTYLAMVGPGDALWINPSVVTGVTINRSFKLRSIILHVFLILTLDTVEPH